MALEKKAEVGQTGEIVRREDFSLNNREIDSDLVEASGVDRSVDDMTFGHLSRRRSTAFWPRWEEQLSIIQKTR